VKLAPSQIEPPADPVISLEEAKKHCRVDHADDDVYIEALVGAAIAHLDGYAGILGRCLVTQKWQVSLTCWPSDRCIRLPFPDVSAVTVKYSDGGNAEQTLDQAANWDIYHDARGGFVYLKNAFSGPTLYDDRLDAVRIEVEAGFGDPEDVPEAIKAAIKLMVGSLYENREDVIVGQSLFVASLPFGVDVLLAPWRRVGV
jgi:uncharacterized phiE125 gp8 family phage protein